MEVREKETLLSLLPRHIQHRARTLLHFLLPLIDVKDGIVYLPGGAPTSPLMDILRFYSSPRLYKAAVPQGLELLNDLMIERNVPHSAFAPGKHPADLSRQTAPIQDHLPPSEELKHKRWKTLF